MLNFDGDVDTDADANVKCEHTFSENYDSYGLGVLILFNGKYHCLTRFGKNFDVIDLIHCLFSFQ